MKKLYHVIRDVLVADNDIFFTRLVENYFKEKGLNVETALDGKEAIEKLSKKQFDLVIVDLVLPKISGKDVVLYITSKCKRNYEDEEVRIILPIVVLTSSTLIEQMEKLKDIDVNFVLAKAPLQMLLEAMNFMIYSELTSLDFKQKELPISDAIFPREATHDLLLELDFYEGLFKQLPLGVVVLDKDTKIIRVNEKGIGIINLPKEDILGREIFDVLPRDVLPELKTAMKKALTDNKAEPSIVLGDLNTNFSQIWVTLLRQEGFTGWLMILLPW